MENVRSRHARRRPLAVGVHAGTAHHDRRGLGAREATTASKTSGAGQRVFSRARACAGIELPERSSTAPPPSRRSALEPAIRRSRASERPIQCSRTAAPPSFSATICFRSCVSRSPLAKTREPLGVKSTVRRRRHRQQRKLGAPAFRSPREDDEACLRFRQGRPPSRLDIECHRRGINRLLTGGSCVRDDTAAAAIRCLNRFGHRGNDQNRRPQQGREKEQQNEDDLDRPCLQLHGSRLRREEGKEQLCGGSRLGRAGVRRHATTGSNVALHCRRARPPAGKTGPRKGAGSLWAESGPISSRRVKLGAVETRE